MTVQNMLDYVWSECDDLLGAYFTQAQVIRYLNQAAGECQKKLVAAGNNWYLKQTPDSGIGSFFTTANQDTYTPPTDLLDINRIEIVQNPGTNENRTALYSITLNQKDYFYGYSQWPVAFFFKKTDIVMCPAPQIGGLLIRYFYTYRIAEVTLPSETIDCPAEFHEYICYLAIMKCFAKDGRDPGYFVQMVNDIEKRLERQAIMRAQDHSPTVVVSSDGSGYGGFY